MQDFSYLLTLSERIAEKQDVRLCGCLHQLLHGAAEDEGSDDSFSVLQSNPVMVNLKV